MGLSQTELGARMASRSNKFKKYERRKPDRRYRIHKSRMFFAYQSRRCLMANPRQAHDPPSIASISFGETYALRLLQASTNQDERHEWRCCS